MTSEGKKMNRVYKVSIVTQKCLKNKLIWKFNYHSPVSIRVSIVTVVVGRWHVGQHLITVRLNSSYPTETWTRELVIKIPFAGLIIPKGKAMIQGQALKRVDFAVTIFFINVVKLFKLYYKIVDRIVYIQTSNKCCY